ncbi:acylphosphatase [Roseomonas aeriglobus]|nr:acylphosphatase [Roseomonas aeriglobus]
MGEMQRVLVSGRVQQVGYRDYVVRQAQKLGVKGWVRNLSDGRVELLADADAAVLDEFLAKCREGPQLARVDDISAFPVEERPVKGFTKRFTP